MEKWLRGDSSRDLLIPKRWRSRFALERVTLSPSQKGRKELSGRLWLLTNTYKVIPRKVFWASWKPMSVFQLFVMRVISVIFWISLEIPSTSTNIQPGWGQDQDNTPHLAAWDLWRNHPEPTKRCDIQKNGNLTGPPLQCQPPQEIRPY